MIGTYKYTYGYSNKRNPHTFEAFQGKCLYTFDTTEN